MKKRLLAILRPPGYNPPDHLDMLWNQWAHQGYLWGYWSYEFYLKLQRGSSVFDEEIQS